MFRISLALAAALVLAVVGWFTLSSRTSTTPDSSSTARTLIDDTDMEEVNAADRAKITGYQNYSAAAFVAALDRRRVYFFHAKWCPTCKAADTAFRANLNQIPEDVAIFITDYDTEAQLKQRYAITYQHTFVQVDAQGTELAKWNGGDLAALLANLK